MSRKAPRLTVFGGIALVLLLVILSARYTTFLNIFRKATLPATASNNPYGTRAEASPHEWQMEINAGCLVTSLAFSPDGKFIAGGTWCSDGVRLWDARTGEVSRHFGANGTWYSVAFSPDGKILAGSNGGEIALWDSQNGSLLRTLSTSAGGMMEIAFSPDGSELATRICCDGVTVFRVTSGKVDRMIHSGYDVESLAFSPDGKTIATGSADYDSGGVSLWDVETGSLKRKLSRSGFGQSVAFSPDGKLVAGGSGDDIRLWDSSMGVLKSSFTHRGSNVHSIAFSPDGKAIAAGGGYWEVSIWDVQLGNLSKKLAGHKDWITALAFSSDGKLLASGSGDGTIKLWK